MATTRSSKTCRAVAGHCNLEASLPFPVSPKLPLVPVTCEPAKQPPSEPVPVPSGPVPELPPDIIRYFYPSSSSPPVPGDPSFILPKSKPGQKPDIIEYVPLPSTYCPIPAYRIGAKRKKRWRERIASAKKLLLSEKPNTLNGSLPMDLPPCKLVPQYDSEGHPLSRVIEMPYTPFIDHISHPPKIEPFNVKGAFILEFKEDQYRLTHENLKKCATLAIYQYNIKVQTKYRFLDINKVKHKPTSGTKWYITFRARLSPKDCASFEAIVHTDKVERIVMGIRIKRHGSPWYDGTLRELV